MSEVQTFWLDAFFISSAQVARERLTFIVALDRTMLRDTRFPDRPITDLIGKPSCNPPPTN